MFLKYLKFLLRYLDYKSRKGQYLHPATVWQCHRSIANYHNHAASFWTLRGLLGLRCRRMQIWDLQMMNPKRGRSATIPPRFSCNYVVKKLASTPRISCASISWFHFIKIVQGQCKFSEYVVKVFQRGFDFLVKEWQKISWYVARVWFKCLKLWHMRGKSYQSVDWILEFEHIITSLPRIQVPGTTT